MRAMMLLVPERISYSKRFASILSPNDNGTYTLIIIYQLWAYSAALPSQCDKGKIILKNV